VNRSASLAKAPPDELEELDEGNEGEGEKSVGDARAFRAIPHNPMRTAMRDELGRRVVGAGASLLPGLAAAAVLAVVGSKLAKSARQWWDGWKATRHGDTSIRVSVLPRGYERSSRVVDVEPEPQPVTTGGAASERRAQAAAPAPPRDLRTARRVEFLRLRELRRRA